jgi:hypothetical protein
MRASICVLLTVAFMTGCEDMDGQQPGKVVITNTRLHVQITPWKGGQAQPTELDAVVIGRVAEIEAETVTVADYKGAPEEDSSTYKVASLKVEDRVLGAAGLTMLRVGFLAEDAPTVLKPGMDGGFALSRHPTSDFYVLVSQPALKKDAAYAAELERLKKVALAISDPVAALKAEALQDRFDAALYLAYRYQRPRGSRDREPIPAEENKLILKLLTELPWNPPGVVVEDPDKPALPHRSFLWYKFDMGQFGYKEPEWPQQQQPGTPPIDGRKFMEDWTTKFINDNADKIRLTRYVQK